MTDIELLELAAKAHGGLVYIDDMGWIHEDKYGNRGPWWNPLENDGDALRLAVKLTLEIDVCRNGMAVRTPTGVKVLVNSKEEPDAYAATRLAIVRAAAEIGKMQK